MRRRRTLQALLALTAVTAATSLGGAAHADDPPTRCDLNVQTPGPGVTVTTIETDLSTGSTNGVRDAYGTVDSPWRVTAPKAGPAYSIAPSGAWPTLPGVNWIGPKKTAESGGGVTPQGPGPIGPTPLPAPTVYAASFQLPETSLLDRLTLTYAPDDGVVFKLNGVAIGGSPVVTATVPTIKSFAYVGPLLKSGVNTLTAEVTDFGGTTGLLVLGKYEGCEVASLDPTACLSTTTDSVSTYVPKPVDVGTGEQGYVPDPIGSTDTKWFTAAPTRGPAYSIDASYGWVTSTRSNWINDTPTQEGNGGDPPTLAASSSTYPTTRTFEIEFTLTPGATRRVLDISYAADNEVSFYLNNGTTPIGGFPAGNTTDGFTSKRTLTWVNAGFVDGVNRLTAVVTDHGLVRGLLVEGGVYSCHDTANNT